MDSLQRTFYQLHFREAFLSKKGSEFQAWFARLAGFAYGSDFEAVRAYGPQGDLKCDGRLRSTGTVFQCYAPDMMTADRTIRKVTEDFHGALANWKNMAEWTFVHNDPRGLPPEVVQHLDSLRSANPQVTIATWGEAQLAGLKERLDLPAMEALFGIVPSSSDFETLVMEDLPPVINDLQRLDPPPEQVPLTPPSRDKLARNDLPGSAAALLAAGRHKEALVDSYFRSHPQPDLGERIAEAFRQTYKRLRDQGKSPDEVFGYLQQYAGSGFSPKRQGAALAVLSYFFERCDIFEDAEPGP